MEKEQTGMLEKSSIIQGLKFAVIVSLFISAIIILITIDQEAFQNAILNINPYFIIYLFIIMFLVFLAGACNIYILVKATDNHISLKNCLIIFISAAFVSNVTPFASGGGPFQLYFLHKKGVNIGKSSVVVIVQLLLRLFFFGILTSVFFIFFRHIVSPGLIPAYIFYLAFGTGLFISVGIILLTLVPQITDKIISLLFKIPKVKDIVKNSHTAKRWLVRAKRELKEFRYSLILISKKKKALFLSGLCTAAHWSLLFLVIPVILMGFGIEVDFFKAYVMQTIFYLIIPFMPTPGASGIAEIGFASLFISFIPGSIIGLVLFTWRIFTFYLVLLFGGIFALKELNPIGSNNDE